MTEQYRHRVYLGAEHVGSLLQRGDVTRFSFLDDYWERPDRGVLGLWFEDHPRESPRAALRLPPWFSNLLPEGPLREWVARDRGVNSQRELQLLLRIGRDLPGAVRVLESIEPERESAEFVGELAVDRRPNAEPEFWKFSLAGVGLKFSLLRQADRLTLPAHNQLGNWIVKFPDRVFGQVPENEWATMTLAAQVGIEVPSVELVHRDELPEVGAMMWPSGETRAFAIERFDRDGGDGRTHIEDFAQVRDFYSVNKYDGSFETVAALAYRGHDRRSLDEAVRRIAFNLLVGNGDAHLKNWSLIYPDRRKPTLSPAYDLVSTAPYSDQANPEDFGLRFGGTKSLARIGRSAFERLEQALYLNRGELLDVVDETARRADDALKNGHDEAFPEVARGWIRENFSSMRARLLKPS